MKSRIKKCKYCNKEFETKNNKQIYCSRSCRRSYYYRKLNPIEEIKCEFCGKRFNPINNRYKYCSKYCAEEMHKFKKRERMCKRRKEFPRQQFPSMYKYVGSRGTGTRTKLLRNTDGKPDFKKEAESIEKEMKRLGIR